MAKERTLFEKLYDVGEENLARFAEEVISNTTISDSMDRTLRNAAETKGKVDQNISALLGLLNLPSKADYNKLVAKVETIQGTLVNINIKLDRLMAVQDRKPKRTRRTDPAKPASKTVQPRRKKPVSKE